MIESLIAHFTKNFAMDQELVDDDTGWYLKSTCLLKGRVVYTHRLHLEPLYESMVDRLNKGTVPAGFEPHEYVITNGVKTWTKGEA